MKPDVDNPLQPPAVPADLAPAAALREAGRYREAQAWLAARLQAAGEDAQTLALLAHVQLLDNQDEAAAAALAGIPALDPALPALWRNVARLALKRNQPAQALAAAQQAARGDPAGAESLLVLASALCAAQRDAEALPLVERVLRDCPAYAEAYTNRALIRLRAGDAAGARDDARQALALKPHLPLWTLVSQLCRRMNDLPGAIAALEQARAREPDNPDHRINLGELLRLSGRIEAALALLEETVARFPDCAPAWANLGTARHAAGQLDEARQAYEQALRLKPDLAEARSNLGVLLGQMGQAEDEEAQCRRAVAENPGLAEAHCNLGVALKGRGRAGEAEACYRQAIALKPGLAGAHQNLGNLLAEAGDLAAAEACYRQAIACEPGFHEAHGCLGNVLYETNRLAEAEASCRRAIALKADYPEGHNNLGNVLRKLERLDEAEACYRQAIALKPGLGGAHRNLGNVYKELSRPDEAERYYRQAIAHKPDDAAYAVTAELLLPVIPDSNEAIAHWRSRFAQGVQRLQAATLSLGDTELGRLSGDTFHLAYHDADDRPLLAALSGMFRRKAPALGFEAPHVAGWRGPRGRIRVGFCSQYFALHTIGKLYQGLIAGLDRARFEVVLIHAPHSKRDETSAGLLDRHADRVVILPRSLAAQQRALAAEALDALFYPDIGMSPATYFLAHARLAPVQALGWGHPDTSGIDTLDYFLSSERIEPPDAEMHYSERLVRLSRLPCCYPPPAAPAAALGRAALGLPAAGTLYGCPQSLFKIHPDFDAVLAGIAAGDPGGRLVFVEGQYPAWSALLRARWAKRHPVLAERALFLPRQPLGRFLALLAHVDVLLDPIHFGSGNTLYEAMAHGTPIVTWPGRFMRGRIVAGAYRQMGVADAPVAERIEDYAPLALALGRDPERRASLRQESRAAAARDLFADAQAVREFETFLIAAVDAAARGERLPEGWLA